MQPGENHPSVRVPDSHIWWQKPKVTELWPRHDMLTRTKNVLTFKTSCLWAKCLHSYVIYQKVLFSVVSYAQPVSGLGLLTNIGTTEMTQLINILSIFHHSVQNYFELLRFTLSVTWLPWVILHVAYSDILEFPKKKWDLVLFWKYLNLPALNGWSFEPVYFLSWFSSVRVFFRAPTCWQPRAFLKELFNCQLTVWS